MKYFYIALILLFNISLFAQAELDFCGTKQGRSHWLKSFQARSAGEKSDFRKGDIIFVPLSIHLVAKDNGKSAYSGESLLNALCNLNEVFLDSDIQFYIKGDVHILNSTAMYDHTGTNKGGEIMLENNIPNSLNCYIVANPASNCGYNLPWAGIALSKSCMGKSELTWAHEIGHALSLPHPFLGWEGGQTHDGSIGANFNNPAPEYVTYNYTAFKEVQYTDTLIIDTSYVELVDGSNCNIAADGFCDTKPDYIASRWSCNSEGLSDENQLDPNGVSFQSDGTVLMGYSSASSHQNSKCNGIFTQEQIEAMRANLLEEKSDWLDQETYSIDGIHNDIVNAFPTEEIKVDFQSVELSWELAEGEADKYIVQVAYEDDMSFIFFTKIISQPFITINGLDNNTTYYWWVRAIDNNEVCSDYGEINAFKTADLSSVDNLDFHICKVYPSVLKTGGSLYLKFEDSQSEYQYAIIDRNGKIVQQKLSTIEKVIQLDHLSSGLYFLKLSNKMGSQISKVIIK